MRLPRIILFSPSIHTGGGTERVLVNLANFLIENGFQTVILTIINGKNEIYGLNNQIKVKKYWFAHLRNKYPGNILLTIINKLSGDILLQSFLKQYAVHNSLIISFSAAITNDCFRTKYKNILISFEHYPYWAYDKHPKAQKQIRSNYPFLKKVIVLTDHEKNVYEKLGCNVIKISNSYPFNPVYPAALSAKKVLSVGHFNDVKRRDLLIQTWGFVNKKYPDWELIIVGDGPRKKECEQLITDLNLNSSIQIIPQTDKILDYYLQASIFVLTSEFETLPMVLLEAKIAGLPCVSFDIVCGPNELINDGEDGFLVEFADTKSMSEKISALIEDTDLRKKMGSAGRADAIKRFNPQTIYKQWSNFLSGYDF